MFYYFYKTPGHVWKIKRILFSCTRGGRWNKVGSYAIQPYRVCILGKALGFECSSTSAIQAFAFARLLQNKNSLQSKNIKNNNNKIAKQKQNHCIGNRVEIVAALVCNGHCKCSMCSFCCCCCFCCCWGYLFWVHVFQWPQNASMVCWCGSQNKIKTHTVRISYSPIRVVRQSCGWIAGWLAG